MLMPSDAHSRTRLRSIFCRAMKEVVGSSILRCTASRSFLTIDGGCTLLMLVGAGIAECGDGVVDGVGGAVDNDCATSLAEVFWPTPIFPALGSPLGGRTIVVAATVELVPPAESAEPI